MGKVIKSKENNMKTGTKVIKQSTVKKPVPKISCKRMMMLRRRLFSVLDEKSSWEDKNRTLLENLNKEKIVNASLKKEVFEWQRLYHEATISINTYKVKQADMVQTMSMCLKEIDSIYPHMVAFSESVTSNKVRISNMLHSIRSLGNDGHLLRHFRAEGKVAEDVVKKDDKRTKHRVGPMVKGVLIQKPTIRLERVRLQQPQHQERVNNGMSSPEENSLAPIAEEDEPEEVHLRHISVRQKRSRLGSSVSWRMRRQEQLDKVRQREKKLPSVVEDSSDSEDNSGAMGHLRPIMRFKDVNILLENSNLLGVNATRGVERNREGSCGNEGRRMRTNEDPLEGCSWMFRSASNPSTNMDRQPSRRYKSDSSDEDVDDILEVVDKTDMSNILKDSLYKNQTVNVSRSSLSEDTSNEASDSLRAEPDSTNNLDEQLVLGDLPERDSLDNINERSCCAYKTSTERKVIKSKHEPNNATECISFSHERHSKRQSSFCDNCSPLIAPEVREKRVRKPKNHTYPGEEDDIEIAQSKLKKSAKFSISRKRNHLDKVSTGRSSTKRENSDQSSISTENKSGDGSSNNSSQKKKRRNGKSSAVKKSLFTPRTSTEEEPQHSQGADNTRPRRNKSVKSYKESSLSMKMRRS